MLLGGGRARLVGAALCVNVVMVCRAMVVECRAGVEVSRAGGVMSGAVRDVRVARTVVSRNGRRE